MLLWLATLIALLSITFSDPLMGIFSKTFSSSSWSASNNTSTSNATMPGKRGLCWPVETTDPLLPFTRPGSKVSWLYNWSPVPHLPGVGGGPGASSIEWVPMQWNAVGSEHLGDRCMSPPPVGNPGPYPAVRAVLGFNEPERGDQAAMTPEAAADAWLAHIEPLRRATPPVRAGSPGIASTEEGIAWLQRFTHLIRARGSDVDFWCLHWYGPADLGAFYDYIWSAHARIGNNKPVWITEFACTNWDVGRPVEKDKVLNFCRESIRYLDTLDWVERYAWFGPMRDTGTVGKWAALLDGSGGISELGKVYRDT